jgi:hypothetical protein
VAKYRKELIDVFPLACGARDLLVTEDQDLEVLSALYTVIFKDRHVILLIRS